MILDIQRILSIITQLINGSNVKVLGEKDGWYQIEIPARYGYVCGEYLRVNMFTKCTDFIIQKGVIAVAVVPREKALTS